MNDSHRPSCVLEPGCDPFPTDLRLRFSERRLPPTVRRILGGAVDSYEKLDARIWDLPGMNVDTARRAAVGAMAAVVRELPDEPVLADWPAGTAVAAVPWPARSIGILKRLGAWSDPERLRHFTYVELASAPLAGAESILSISVTGDRTIQLGKQVAVDGTSNGALASWLEVLAAAEDSCASLESASWFSAVHDEDPRFGATARTARAVLAHHAGSLSETALRRLPEEVLALRRYAESERPEPLEAAVSAVLVARAPSLTPARVEVVLRRFGWTGDDPLTLGAAAPLVGLTQERIRQITVGVDKRRPRYPPFMPTLDLVLRLLQDSLPIDEVDFRARQRDAGLASFGLTVEGLRHAAAWNHRGFPEVTVVRNGRTRRVTAPHIQRKEKAVIAEARRQCRTWGRPQ